MEKHTSLVRRNEFVVDDVRVCGSLPELTQKIAETDDIIRYA
jgi:hypothetical protein